MESAIGSAIQSLLLGPSHLEAGQALMMLIGASLLYLGIQKGFEPLLLVPIGFGAILVNIPQSELMEKGGGCSGFSTTLELGQRSSRS